MAVLPNPWRWVVFSAASSSRLRFAAIGFAIRHVLIVSWLTDPIVEKNRRPRQGKAARTTRARVPAEAADRGERWKGDSQMVRHAGADRRSALWLAALAALGFSNPAGTTNRARDGQHWIGTWATAPQAAIPGHAQIYRNQTLRLIVHVSAGGRKVRIKISNTFGDQPLLIGGAHIARRTEAAEIDPASDRTRQLLFELDVPALGDLAISLFFP